MKIRKITGIACILLLSLSCATQPSKVAPATEAPPKEAEPVTYTVGGTGPAGGIVIYDKGSYDDGWRWLEASSKDISTKCQWFNGTVVSVPTDTVVGSGKANTASIISAQGKGSYAAALCAEYEQGGFADWFLPSKDELGLMYEVKKAGKSFFGYMSLWYWSSSQIAGNNAWLQKFDDGGQYTSDENEYAAVRAIRAF
jgi:hypothetical protein